MKQKLLEYRVYYKSGESETFYSYMGINYVLCTAYISMKDRGLNPYVDKIQVTEEGREKTYYNPTITFDIE